MATLKDVAKKAGVNISTASRALNGMGNISEVIKIDGVFLSCTVDTDRLSKYQILLNSNHIPLIALDARQPGAVCSQINVDDTSGMVESIQYLLHKGHTSIGYLGDYIIKQTLRDALVTALAVSGLATGRFAFEGFLPVGRKERRERLAPLVREERTMVFYEAPHRLRTTLADLLEVLGDREAALCRELTKLHEETRRTTLAQAVEYYRENEPRGEFVLVVAGAEPGEEAAVSLEQGAAQVLALRAKGVRMKDAVRQVSEAAGLNRNELYSAALKAGEGNCSI